MNIVHDLIQLPPPGTRRLMVKGDTVTFHLKPPAPWSGTAWLRTNLGHAAIQRQEIVDAVESGRPPLGRDWYDIPMQAVDEHAYRLTLGLTQVGHFEGKCYFLKRGESGPIWPAGDNTTINVEPADTCCANIIYNAFVRQFGPSKAGKGMPLASQEAMIKPLDAAGYTVIPPSGTFRDLIKELDFIIDTLGCRIIQLLPIHPTPTTYARMGRFGSPYAALSFTAVDPALAQFDPKATPVEQFGELVDAIHARNGKLIIDIAINHTGWAADLHESHPRWLSREPDGEIQRPGAWGITWADLTRLDFSHRDLWWYMADVFLTWCRRGVDGFRCDAGYMIPIETWRYIIAKVRQQYPDTLFLLEGLGGSIEATRRLLDVANFNWAYSELFQNYDRGQIEYYLPGAMEMAASDGLVVHFAETHDNNRLASRSKTWSRMRTALCALLSHQGAYGFANGVEWFADQKIDVHGSPPLNWSSPSNQTNAIRRLSTLLKHHPAFYQNARLSWVQAGDGNFVAMARQAHPWDKALVVLANLDDHHSCQARFRPLKPDIVTYLDLLTLAHVTLQRSSETHEVILAPGQVLCLSQDPQDGTLVAESEARALRQPPQTLLQRRQAKVLEVIQTLAPSRDLADIDLTEEVQKLFRDPVSFCRSLNPFSSEPRVVVWSWPRDLKRCVMVPPDHFLLVRTPVAFRAVMMAEQRAVAVESSFEAPAGSFFALFLPLPTPSATRDLELHLTLYEPEGCRHARAPLHYLALGTRIRVQRTFHRSEVLSDDLLYLGTNGRGAMLRARADWTALHSRYDALLAANLHPSVPEDRRILLTRMRGWVVYQGYSQTIGLDKVDAFGFNYTDGTFWQYHIPTGQGEHVIFKVAMEMVAGKNQIHCCFYRRRQARRPNRLSDSKLVDIILRPDIEDRGFHDVTKAYLGAEARFYRSVQTSQNGFWFSPTGGHGLSMTASQGRFVWEPEWHYMVHRKLEAERGLDPDSDLFSPGYFQFRLGGGDAVTVTAEAAHHRPMDSIEHAESQRLLKKLRSWSSRHARKMDPCPALKQALAQFVVGREQFQTVIAGYPWFLDWGRDTLIVVRAMIAAGDLGTAREVLLQFARFEQKGTLPNMIRGDDASNRDTSDAPLWFMLACADLIACPEGRTFLESDCGQRRLRQVLIDMGQALWDGTPNGIGVDLDSILLFSPAHFTWMDTNHPAGSPRKGYPIEIQALWIAALDLLSRIDTASRKRLWRQRALKARQSLQKHFQRAGQGYLSDCLHAGPGIPATAAVADNALRPNQLLAITLGAVTDPTIGEGILSACSELLIPGAIRSLADRPVAPPLAIHHQGRLLNDPSHPYQGTYSGDEDTHRKPAYHNGTAWTLMFPSFCEAWARVYGPAAHTTALNWLASAVDLLNRGCMGHLPEILDGDWPHRPRGCDAQAWGVSELLRVWLKLTPPV